MVSRYSFVVFGTLLLFVDISIQKNLDLNYLQDFVDNLGDEIISHQGIRNPRVESSGNDDDDDIPHPVGVYNWGSNLDVGQISGVSVNPTDQPVIFHRGPNTWDLKSFDRNHMLVKRNVIKEETILTLDPDTGDVMHKFGGDRFYMPHGITIDSAGNVYVTDVGLHQIFRFPAGNDTPDLVLGEAFVPGSDNTHFCQPTDIAVSELNGDFFVADGYCNKRVLKFNRHGVLLKIIEGDWNVVHSLALFDDDDVLCVANREGQTVECFGAGQRRPLGSEVVTYNSVGRVFGIASKGTALIAVNGSPRPGGITIDTSADEPKIIDHWGQTEGLSQPHDLAVSLYGDSIYVAEIDPLKPNKLHKFEVIHKIYEDEF